MEKSDFLVIGAGIAGLSFALYASRLGKVNLILKDKFIESSTQLAQGGINAVLGEQDTFGSHIQDTIDCGYGLCHEDVVKQVVEGSPEAIERLIEFGAEFTTKDGKLSLHREGGHSFNRVVHAQDATGAEIMRALVEEVRKNDAIRIFDDHMAVDLILKQPLGAKIINKTTRAAGAYVLRGENNTVVPFLAPIVYLATGALGKIYPYTSNPRTATGDGIAMAYRAGIAVVNMEFIQFHPTILYHNRESSFLITEAVRGEGGILKNVHGHAFMVEYHPILKDLAPRDVVARAIDDQIKKTGHECVYLDLTHKPAEEIKYHFPNIYNKLIGLGIDMTKDSIPVVPAAHYSCGGLKVNLHGETCCEGLFAGGECTFTGLHGANRLASNSLLEAAVYARASYEYIEQNQEAFLTPLSDEVADWVYHDYSDEEEASLTHTLWKEVRQFMWDYVGIIRTDKRLERALRRIQFLRKEIENSYWNFRITKDLVELRNISIVAELVIRSAMARKESRGLHYNMDHPELAKEFEEDTVFSLRKHGLFH